MKIWIYLNGLQQGPYTFEQAKLLPLTPTTPVWYDGLPKWIPAAQAPLTAPLFMQSQTECENAEGAAGDTHEPASAEPQSRYIGQQSFYQPGQPSYAHYSHDNMHREEPAPKQPPTYMAWCILLTILCCSPLALAGIITGSISTSRYNSGDYEGAKSMSVATEWLLILSIVWAIIGLPVALAFNL